MTSLGILGGRQDLTQTDMATLLDLVCEDDGLPMHLNLQQEGYTSIYAETWADSHGLGTKIFPASFVRDGRRATMLRDQAIIRDSTVFLVISGPRSDRPLRVATALAQKGRKVFYLPPKSLEVAEIVIEPSPLKPGRKACKETSRSPQLTLEQVGLSKSQ